jgi:Mg2+ and Co2+ transporter CorA
MTRPLRRTPPEPAEVLRQVKQQFSGVASDLRTTAKRAKKQAKRQVNDVVKAIVETVHEEAERLFDERRDRAAAKVEKLGKMVHQASHALHAVRMDGVADAIDSAGERVESLSEYIKDRNLNDIIQDAGEIVNEHKALAIGGLFITGFAVARFLKASEANLDNADDEDSDSPRSSGRKRLRSGGKRR